MTNGDQLWRPAPRPDWVRAVNAGEVEAVSARAPAHFALEALLDEAATEVGVGHLASSDLVLSGDDADIGPTLITLLEALDERARLTTIGRWFAWRYLRRLLSVRARLAVSAGTGGGDSAPGPLFVAGADAAGARVLQTLLAADPAHRAPTGREFLQPVPFEDAARLAQDELAAAPAINPSLVELDPRGVDDPAPCDDAMALSFLADDLAARWRLPGYDPTAAPRRTYAAHAAVLRTLSDGQRRWILRSMTHLDHAAILPETHRGASVVVVHRDPAVVVASQAARTVERRWVGSDHVDPTEVGRVWLDRLASTLDRLVDQDLDSRLDRCFHVHHTDLVARALPSIADLYERLALPLTDAAVDAMTTVRLPAAPTPPPERFGLDRAEIAERVGRYVEHFAVPAE